jgi:hypothetical protein
MCGYASHVVLAAWSRQNEAKSDAKNLGSRILEFRSSRSGASNRDRYADRLISQSASDALASRDFERRYNEVATPINKETESELFGMSKVSGLALELFALRLS